MACRSGSAGAACAAGCPLTLPLLDAQHLVLWLVGDTYASGAAVWTDESGHADATCSPPCPSVGSLNGRGAVSFAGSSYFALGDPGGLYQTTAFTVFLVAAPASGAASNAVILGFSDGTGDALSVQRNGSAPDLMMQLLPGSSTNSIVASGAWAGTAETIVATVNTAGAALTVGSASNAGAIGTPANYTSAYLGTDPSTQTATFTGQIAEVIVFDTVLSSTSIASVRSYISARYGL
jgi:hypothetical protein